LGIDNATHVVLVPMGMNSTDVGVATRVYWTFKVLGHDNVSILDGGMAAWTKEQDKTKANPVQAGAQKAEAKAFKASLRQEMLVTMDDVKKAKAAGVLLVDHRPEDQYVGINRHPKAPRAAPSPARRTCPTAG
jgi:thiosulfate/3-mercaptopyruvate sulfurtransferase